MNKISLIVFAFFLSTVIGGCNSSKNSANAVQSDGAKTTQLFNGKNLDGWYTFIQHRGRDTDPKKVFTVKDAMIHVSGKEYGCITTNEEFSDYRLVLEFKWGTNTYAPRLNNAMDNGVLLHSTGADGGYSGIWMHSLEVNIIEGGTGDLLVVGDGTDKFSMTSLVAPAKPGSGKVFMPGGTPVTINSGRIDWIARDPEWKDVKGYRGKNDVEKLPGEWNLLEVVAEGDKISAKLNGVLVSEAFNVKPTRGRIQLQSEGAEIFYRRVDLTPLK